ncbi:MAG TPA: enoyl-CoA hydratase-related protein, partial [Acidimicrobiales bacterium]|nr:enoyl-CoA hydratase-related protein [Acidimicrobiales bacterium]
LPFVTALDHALQAAGDERRPLVLTGQGKFFSNGLDLDWLRAAGPDGGAEMMAALHRVLARLLAFPGATVAAVNGHAFGAGAILAAAADMRVMRQDRGYFCFPEVDLGLAMSEQFDAVLQAKYPRSALLTGLLTGRRYGADEARALGFVDETASEDQLVATALDRARALAGKDGATVGAIKASLYRSTLAVLAGD